MQASSHTHTRTHASKQSAAFAAKSFVVLAHTYTHMQTCLCMCVKGKKSCVSHAQNVFFILKSRVPLLQMATKQRRRAPLHASSHLLTETEAEHIVICLPSCLAARLAALKMPTVCHHLGSFLTYKHLSRGGLSRPGLG